MRIVIITETFAPEVNGVAMTIGHMIDGLVDKGHTVHVYRPCQGPHDKPTSHTQVQQTLLTGMHIPLYQQLRFGLCRPGRLLHEWRTSRPDIVHIVTEGPLGLAALMAAKRLDIPTTSSFHTNFHSYSNHYGLSFLSSAITRYLRWLHNQTQVTFVPTRTQRQTLEALGINNTAIVSRGVDTTLFNPNRRNECLRRLWGAEPSDPVILYVGRLATEKNVNQVYEAYQLAAAQNSRAQLVFVGDGPKRAALEKRCPDATFCGTQSGVDLAEHYASADIFVFPSQTETFGNVTTEALASGMAVVAYDHAAAGELIRDGENGRTVPMSSPDIFNQVVAELTGDKARRRALRRAASASVAHLTWELISDQVETLLSQAAASRPSPMTVSLHPSAQAHPLDEELNNHDHAA